VQKFVVRNDVGCGSTIGPMLAASTSMRTVDVGVPQLAMHSVREMCGTQDLLNSYTLLKGLFTEYSAIDATLLGTD
jgi:aspartyl aminopeptidase